MMHIYCPYCGTSYDIDESLMPEDNVKVRCRSCANVFILNKENGAIKDELKQEAAGQEYEPAIISQPENDLNANELKTEEKLDDKTKTHKKDGENIIKVDDFMKSLMQEIDSSVHKEIEKEKNNKGNEKSKDKIKKNKINILQIIMLILLIILLIIAGTYTLDYYKIINLPLIFPKPFQ